MSVLEFLLKHMTNKFQSGHLHQAKGIYMIYKWKLHASFVRSFVRLIDVVNFSFCTKCDFDILSSGSEPANPIFSMSTLPSMQQKIVKSSKTGWFVSRPRPQYPIPLYVPLTTQLSTRPGTIWANKNWPQRGASEWGSEWVVISLLNLNVGNPTKNWPKMGGRASKRGSEWVVIGLLNLHVGGQSEPKAPDQRMMQDGWCVDRKHFFILFYPIGYS